MIKAGYQQMGLLLEVRDYQMKAKKSRHMLWV